MTNYVVFNSAGRILGNVPDPEWVSMSGDPSLDYMEHAPVDPKTHKVVNSEVVAKSQHQVDAESARRENNRVWMALRQKRDLMLQKTDWTQVPDAPADPTAWAAYRQALRDLPQNTTDPRNPIWPARPE